MQDGPGYGANEITAQHFPTPDLALRSNDPAEQARVRRFSGLQAAAARQVRDELRYADWDSLGSRKRVALLKVVYQKLRYWRYGIAAATTEGRRAEHFLQPIVDGNDNYDRLGDVGRLRDGATWDPDARTLVGGEGTPASRILIQAGRIALARFDQEAPDHDVLQTGVVLPRTGDRVRGNRLLRGTAARAAAEELVERQRRRGNPIDGFDVGGELLYAATASQADRVRMHRAALRLLALEWPTLRDWCDAVYLLYQAPLDKKGSDAVNRTFAVGVGAHVLDFGGTAPRLVHDVDLMAMVAGQDVFRRYLAEAEGQPQNPPMGDVGA